MPDTNDNSDFDFDTIGQTVDSTYLPYVPPDYDSTDVNHDN